MTKFYEDIAPYYDDITSRYFDYSHALDLIKKLAKGKKLLSLGSGTATLEILLAEDGFDVTGIECSRPMFEIARKKIAQACVNVRLFEVNAGNFSLDEKFDTVFSYRAVHVIIKSDGQNYFESFLPKDKVSESFKSINEHLNPQGRFLIDMMDERNPDVALDIGDENQYTVAIRKNSDKIMAVHRISKKGNIIAESRVQHYFMTISEYHAMARRAGFTPCGPDRTDSFHVLVKNPHDHP